MKCIIFNEYIISLSASFASHERGVGELNPFLTLGSRNVCAKKLSCYNRLATEVYVQRVQIITLTELQ